MINRSRNRTRTWAAGFLAGAAALLAAAPGMAAPWDKHHRRGDEDRSWERIRELADEVEDATDRALSDARRHGHYRRDGRHDLLVDLEDCAEVFERAVGRNRDLYRSVDEFRGLSRAHRDAVAVYSRSRNRAVVEELYRIDRLLGAIESEYEYALSDRRYRSRDHDRWDRDDRRYRDRTHHDERWRNRGGARIVLPRIRIELPF